MDLYRVQGENECPIRALGMWQLLRLSDIASTDGLAPLPACLTDWSGTTPVRDTYIEREICIHIQPSTQYRLLLASS